MRAILSILLAASAAFAQDANSRAAQKHPALKVQGSELHSRFMTLYGEAVKTQSPVLSDPEWPTVLADRAAADIAKPKTPAKQGLSGFLNIAWGTPRDEAVRLMSARDGVTVSEGSASAALFKGGQFAGVDVSLWALAFDKEGRMHTGRASMHPRPSTLLDKYSDIKSLMAEKYGKPATDIYRFHYPYDSDSEGHELTAIRVGKATIASYWTFPSPGKPDNIISVRVTESQAIMITYQNGDLIRAVTDDKKGENMKDL